MDQKAFVTSKPIFGTGDLVRLRFNPMSKKLTETGGLTLNPYLSTGGMTIARHRQDRYTQIGQ